MKRNVKKILTLVILSLMALNSAFATEWARYNTFEDDKYGTYDVYIDVDAAKPFDLKYEREYFLLLKDEYEKVDVLLLALEDWMLCAPGVEKNCYATLVMYKDFRQEYHVHSDGTVIVYTYTGFKGE